ncbi:glutamate racemase [Catalinimonas alkaloidigena]|uniref:glutamate racemase n=1 Tax=Catalinimonas alkaloidigena TaxID=1075417 RepID=UPI000B7C7012
MLRPEQPLGIFDSGIGGLTVAHAVTRLLPSESIIYFGDTAHLPYGDKSTAAIQAYSIKICDLLLQQGAKVILIACNSASVSAYDLVREYVGSRAKVLNVIDPVVHYIGENYANRTVGLIGTRRTVSSGVYRQKIKALRRNITLKSLATPLLVPMIEEGFVHNRLSQYILDMYLTHKQLESVEALILGCTHYPLIRPEVEAYYGDRLEVIDSSEMVARALYQLLEEHHLLNQSGEGTKRFLVSDFTRTFQSQTRLFFGEKVELETYPLWE